MPGSEHLFDDTKLRELCGCVEGYRRAAGIALLHNIEDGFLLPCDAETLRRETVENVVF